MATAALDWLPSATNNKQISQSDNGTTEQAGLKPTLLIRYCVRCSLSLWAQGGFRLLLKSLMELVTNNTYFGTQYFNGLLYESDLLGSIQVH